MIQKYVIDNILSRARIEEVVGDFIELHKKGTRYLGLCPFHQDKHLGNFVVYPKGNCYKCFACDAKGGVVDFLIEYAKLSYPDAIHYLGKKYNIDTDMNNVNITLPPPRPVPPPLPTLNLPWNMVIEKQQLDDDLLVNYIRTGVNWNSVSRSRIDEMLSAYHIGHSKYGHTIFWQIDENNSVRTGKMMKYKADGHRDKESTWNFDWITAKLTRKKNEDDPWPFPQYFNPDCQEMRQTLFGMHLLNKYGRSANVCIVESEKTALLMAIAYGNHANQVWMACGGMENLSRERLAPIISQRRRIILYPDRDGVDKWRIKAEQLHYERLTIDTQPVLEWWKECDGPKADIADVVTRIINESKPIKSIPDVIAKHPQAKPLIDKLNLDIEQ